MESTNFATSFLTILTVITTILLTGTGLVFAHCDTMDGPVIKAAQKALDTGDVNHVLIWVQKKDEQEIKENFKKALAVRKLNPAARELADMYFFETLVRIHRAGEGAPYTGIEPAGTDLGPAITEADRALEKGSADALLKMMTDTVNKGIREHYERAMKLKKHVGDSVEAGREYVEAYVEYVHYVEGLYDMASGSSAHHE